LYLYDTTIHFTLKVGHPVAQLVEALRHNPEGSIPDGVTGIFHRHNLSGRTMALGSTQPLTQMRISWVVKAAGA